MVAAWLVDGRTGLASLLLLPAAAWLAVDRYRGLGHALTARHLVTRLGGLRRRTVALQRDGVIGWTFRQSVFQRNAGVVTAEAVTAAGRGGYLVLDVAAGDAVALADATTPDLLRPFLADARRVGPASGPFAMTASTVMTVQDARQPRSCRDPERSTACGTPVLREHRFVDGLLAPGDRRAAHVEPGLHREHRRGRVARGPLAQRRHLHGDAPVAEGPNQVTRGRRRPAAPCGSRASAPASPPRRATGQRPRRGRRTA